MPVKLGTSAVTIKLGAQSVTGYLGSTNVTAVVPGAPTITTAQSTNGEIAVIYSAPASDGGSPITEYRLYLDGLLVLAGNPGLSPIVPGTAGQVVEVSAVNAVGEGPKSAPFTAVPSP